MAVMMRTRPAAKPAVEQPAAPARRMFRQSKAAPSEKEKEKQLEIVKNKLQLIAMDAEKIERLQKRIQPEIDACNQSIEKQKKDIEAALKAAGVPGYSDGIWEALFETPTSRGSREFDNEKVYKALNIKDFLKVVKVQATEVAKVMSQREIEKVSVMHEGAKKDPVFVCRRVPKKGK